MEPIIQKVETDIIILGGGIQGVWLLADLVHHGYQTLLLERSFAGCGQTGHSHVFLHRGHMHASMKVRDTADAAIGRMKVFGDAWVHWHRELSQGRLKNIKPLKSSFYIGFQGETRANEFRLLCEAAGLDCTQTNAPQPFNDPYYPYTFETEGICLESEVVLDCLLAGGLKERTARCKKVIINDMPSKRFLVKARIEGGDYEITCKGLVLAAGAGNESLVSEVLREGGIELDVAQTRQQTVKTYMLVVKGSPTDLKPVCGLLPEPVGIFIAYRRDHDGTVVWLIADRQRQYVSLPGHWTAFDAKEWFSNIKGELRALGLLETPDRFQWGIYEATKAEAWTHNEKQKKGGLLPSKHTIFKDSERNIWVTWPGFLTLAPVAASEISSQIKTSLPASSKKGLPDNWSPDTSPLTTDKDRWCTTPLLNWDEFSRCYA